MPVKAMTMPFLLHSSMTRSSRMEPPGWAMYFTPEAKARLMLSLKGKKASLPKATLRRDASQAFLSPSVSRSGCSVK